MPLSYQSIGRLVLVVILELILLRLAHLGVVSVDELGLAVLDDTSVHLRAKVGGAGLDEVEDEGRDRVDRSSVAKTARDQGRSARSATKERASATHRKAPLPFLATSNLLKLPNTSSIIHPRCSA